MSNKTTVKNVLFLGAFAFGIVLFAKKDCPAYINFIEMSIAEITSIRFI